MLAFFLIEFLLLWMVVSTLGALKCLVIESCPFRWIAETGLFVLV